MASAASEPDVSASALSLALLLYDGFTGAQELVGDISVSLENEPMLSPLLSPLFSPPESFPSIRQTTFRKIPKATFLFFGLPPDLYSVHVRSNVELPDETPPYYLPADFLVNVSDLPVGVASSKPIWPAFPDINLADSTKPLDDPAQSAAYRVQRQAATLQPSTVYPFPAGSTLVRGVVLANGAPLSGATVQHAGEPLQYLTDDNGEFVLFFRMISGVGETITLQAQHALHPPVQQNIEVHRGMTVATNIIMAP